MLALSALTLRRPVSPIDERAEDLERELAIDVEGSVVVPDFDDDEVTREVHLLSALASTEVVAIRETMPLAELAGLLVDQRVPALVVVDEGRIVRGLVTRTDVIEAMRASLEVTAGDVMSTLVFTLPVESTIESAAALMAYEAVGQIVVVGARGELVAVVSALDIARHLATSAGYRGL